MKFRKFFKNISFRLTLLIATSQTILYLVFALIIIRSTGDAVAVSELDTFNLLSNMINWAVEEEIQSADLAIISVADDEKILELFSSGNREKLYSYILPLYDKIKNRVARFHFHNTDGTSFLRMHDYNRHGDNLIDKRPMIKEALNGKKKITGIEKGSEGLFIRVIHPLFYQGNYIGAVEYGIDFGNKFAEKLQQKYEGDYYVFSLNKDGTAAIIAGTKDSDSCPDDTDSYKSIIDGDGVWSLDCSKARAVGLFPYHDFSGNIIGFIKAELYRIPLSDAVNLNRRNIIILGVLLTASLGVTTFLGLKMLFKPLRSVVDQTCKISERIIAGDAGYQGDVLEAAEDFRDVINAVNLIISALRERENLLKAIVEGIPGIVYYVGSDLKVIWANERAKRMIPDIVGLNPEKQILSSGFFNQEKELLEKAFSTGEISVVEACYINTGKNSAGNECWEHVAVPIPDKYGKIENVIRICRDVTDKIKAETDLRTLNETLEKIVEDEIRKRKEKEAIAAQQSRLAAIGELATGMAHEIAQPLNAISFSMENIFNRFSNGNMDAPYMRKKIDAIYSDVERIRRVINHVRLFSRSGAEEYRIPFNINRCIDNALGMIGAQLSSKEIDLILNLNSDLPDISGNPYQYEQVLLNLLSNARDAVTEQFKIQGENKKAKGMIKISTFTDMENVVLDVTDNGSGIPDEIKEKLFDPFFTTKPLGKGTGLGLSISFGIVREIGGSITSLKIDGKTVMRVSVPAFDKNSRGKI